MINSNAIVSATEANQNFSRVARMAESQGHVVVFKNNRPKLLVIDLDNFKLLNDTYGHGAGDTVLITVANGLAKYTNGYGLAGRFGGDELLLIDLHNTSGEDKQSFFERLYSDSCVFRNSVEFEEGSAFVTATCGAASYPEDADNFDDLFGLIDKMLYLGKSRGRNCYSIYDADSHRDIEIKKIANQGVFTSMTKLRSAVENAEGFEEKSLLLK